MCLWMLSLLPLQFEEDMVDICMKLLDMNPKCLRDPAEDFSARCNPIYVGRVVSAMVCTAVLSLSLTLSLSLCEFGTLLYCIRKNVCVVFVSLFPLILV